MPGLPHAQQTTQTGVKRLKRNKHPLEERIEVEWLAELIARADHITTQLEGNSANAQLCTDLSCLVKELKEYQQTRVQAHQQD
ncbi:MAG: hypothetical protein F6K11_25445 [Leptolyngbya sp. SIO3F4]|nr:hypothetical protein [Leptolyngbya sp. SIO3F4]